MGSRGLVSLPTGFIYHDNETLDASREVAKYAKQYQEVSDHQVAQKRLISLQNGGNEVSRVPKYTGTNNRIGKEVSLNSILGFEESRQLTPPEENRFNKPLPEIERERENGKIRLLPGEGVIPSQKYAAKTSNRFENQNVEESERSKNTGQTIFDDGLNETKLKYQYKSRPILKEYYDKYFGKESKSKHAIKETPRSKVAVPSSPPSSSSSLLSPHNIPTAPVAQANFPKAPTNYPPPFFTQLFDVPPVGHYSYHVNHRG